MTKRGLGKGLASLLGDSFPLQEDERSDLNNNYLARMNELDIDYLKPGRYQPRQFFDEGAILELSDSIRENGIMQPLVVYKINNENYEIIAGERRYRAAKTLGIKKVPVTIVDCADEKLLELSLVENIQREDLNAIEEMNGYIRLINEFNYTQEKIAKMVGKSRSYVANTMRLNSLPELVKEKIKTKELTQGHARCLVGHDNAEEIMNIIIQKNLNVRQTELLIKNLNKQNSSTKEINNKSASRVQDDREKVSLVFENLAAYQEVSHDMELLIQMLSDNLGIKISIDQPLNGKEGKIVLHFSSFEQLDFILNKLN